MRHWFHHESFHRGTAFPGSPHLVDEVKVGVLMGSVLSAFPGGWYPSKSEKPLIRAAVQSS